MAQRIVREESKATDRIELAYRLCLSRSPTEKEIQVVERMLTEFHSMLKQDEASTRELLSLGESEKLTDIDQVELATWTMVCSTIFNLDETVTQH